MQRVLIVDDEPNIRRMVGALLSAEGYEVREAADGAAGVRAVEEEEPDVALIDLMMPGGMDGIATLAKIRERWSDLPVIMMSGRASLSDAVRATKVGAVNFLEKPLAPETVLLALGSALELRQARRAARVLRAELGRTGEMVGSSSAMVRVRELTARVALSDARVLISGESGTGKELVAAAIHEHGPRRDRPFVRVNCAAIPRDLVESEMFGHEKGSFTGAAERRIGKFELADTGTLFLDEIGDLSMEAQAKLLRAIEAKEIQRVGGNKTIKVDVRIIAATNHDLAKAVDDGEFREDLYFRLNVIPIHLPPLRERGNDVIELIHHFSEIQHQRTGRPTLTWSADAEARMRSYAWPGNVRELANIVERLAILSNDSHIRTGDIAAVLPAPRDTGAASTAVSDDRGLTDTLDDMERRMIADALAWASGNVAEAARRLQTDRANLYRRMKRLGMAATVLALCSLSLLTALSASPRLVAAQGVPARTDTTISDTTPAYDYLSNDDRPYIHLEPSLSSGKTYNRVEGLSVLLGPALTIETPKFALDGTAYLIARTARGFSTAEPDGGHDLRIRTRFGPDKSLGLEGRLYSVISPVESWQLTEPEEGLAAFLFRRDYRDYYGRHGGRINASWTFSRKAAFSAGYAVERWSTTDEENPFTLFRPTARWRQNPAVDEGVFHLLTFSGTFDTRNDEREPNGGWYLTGTFEHGSSPSVILAPRVQNPVPSSISSPPQPISYGRVFFDLRRYNRVSPRTQLDGRIVAGGWVSGDELPLERKLSVTGSGVLPGYEFRETQDGPDVMQCTARGVVASDNPVMCDRIVLGQLELRTQLASHPFDIFNIPALRLRSVGFTASPVGVFFVDVGRGWRTTTPWPSSYKADVGAGLDLGLLGAYVAKAVTDGGEPLRFFVRIRRRF
ncbi:MAG TPA: sigma 54-interacting transcriptional regulator [Gemmatimonadaceae bacterium]|nr:sigma 54-interacting transcriptional regulator [Gemmatimonadaceae bacterium]